MWFNFFQQAGASTAATTALRAAKRSSFWNLRGSRWNKRQIRYLWYRTPGTFTDIAVKGQDVDHRQGVTLPTS